MSDDAPTEVKETATISTPHETVTTTTTAPPVKTEHPQQVFNKKKTIFRTYQIVWYILGVLEILLGFRMTLKALGANPLSEFISFIYAFSNLFAFPFSGILPNTISGNSIFEWSTLIAALVYAVVAYGIIHVMQIMKPVTQKEVEQKVDETS